MSWGTLPKRCSITDSTANKRASTEAVNGAYVITKKCLENKLCLQKMTSDSYGTKVCGY
jgi:plasmid replication initiation protein